MLMDCPLRTQQSKNFKYYLVSETYEIHFFKEPSIPFMLGNDVANMHVEHDWKCKRIKNMTKTALCEIRKLIAKRSKFN